jgi:hypothetical protein
VEKYATSRSDRNHNEGQKTKKEPGGAAELLLTWLGDAEGPEEGGRNGFKESHVLMVRAGKRLNPWGWRLSRLSIEVTSVVP